MCELQNQIGMLKCQNKLLADKLDTYQTVAEKAAVRVAQYKERRGASKSQGNAWSDCRGRCAVGSQEMEWR